VVDSQHSSQTLKRWNGTTLLASDDHGEEELDEAAGGGESFCDVNEITASFAGKPLSSSSSSSASASTSANNNDAADTQMHDAAEASPATRLLLPDALAAAPFEDWPPETVERSEKIIFTSLSSGGGEDRPFLDDEEAQGQWWKEKGKSHSISAEGQKSQQPRSMS
jgi:hypothetical protein